MTIPIKQEQPLECARTGPSPCIYQGNTPPSTNLLRMLIKGNRGWLRHEPRSSQQIFVAICPNLNNQQAWCAEALPVLDELLSDCGYEPEPHPTEADQWQWVVGQPLKPVEAEWDEVFLEEWT